MAQDPFDIAKPLDLAVSRPRPLHPPTEPQPHLNRPERGTTLLRVVEFALGSVLLVFVLFLALVYN